MLIDKPTIGGTDISAIVGCNPWKSAFSVYQKMIGEPVEVKDTPQMERGRFYENILASIYSNSHASFKVVYLERIESPLVHGTIDYLTGTPDRIYFDLSKGITNKDKSKTCQRSHGLEVKTADISQRNQYDFTDSSAVQIPMHYYLQCQWYAGLAKVPRWDFIVGFFKDEQLKSIEQCSFDADTELFDHLINEAVEFYESCVVPKIPPPITDPVELETYSRKRFPRHVPKTYAERTRNSDHIVGNMIELAEKIRLLELEQQMNKASLIALLEDKEALETPFGNVTYRTNKDSEIMDWKAHSVELERLLHSEIVDVFRKKHTTTKQGARVLRLPKVR
jgi:predicted phage-related endonuclease